MFPVSWELILISDELLLCFILESLHIYRVSSQAAKGPKEMTEAFRK